MPPGSVFPILDSRAGPLRFCKHLPNFGQHFRQSSKLLKLISAKAFRRVFTCKISFRYSRERALKSLPGRAEQRRWSVASASGRSTRRRRTARRPARQPRGATPVRSSVQFAEEGGEASHSAEVCRGGCTVDCMIWGALACRSDK